SSRRRHTRSKRDWSSDVCSSDLSSQIPPQRALATREKREFRSPCQHQRAPCLCESSGAALRPAPHPRPSESPFPACVVQPNKTPPRRFRLLPSAAREGQRPPWSPPSRHLL